jgi:hypothetical protein
VDAQVVENAADRLIDWHLERTSSTKATDSTLVWRPAFSRYIRSGDSTPRTRKASRVVFAPVAFGAPPIQRLNGAFFIDAEHGRIPRQVALQQVRLQVCFLPYPADEFLARNDHCAICASSNACCRLVAPAGSRRDLGSQRRCQLCGGWPCNPTFLLPHTLSCNVECGSLHVLY